MNKINQYLILCLLSVVLAGCRASDWWFNGVSFLEAPQPTLQQWEKPGVNSEGRREDALKCGANPYDVSMDWVKVFEKKQTDAVQHSDEAEQQASSSLYHEWERCMFKAGYHYTGQCYYNDKISSARPACGAP